MAKGRTQGTLTLAELQSKLRKTQQELRHIRKQNKEIWREREQFRKEAGGLRDENVEPGELRDTASANEEELQKLTQELTIVRFANTELVTNYNRLMADLGRATAERDLLRELLELTEPMLAIRLEECLETFGATPTDGTPAIPVPAAPTPTAETAVDGT